MGGEELRPGFHFTPSRNWMNDPNGLVYVDGLWHLFFQYNPEGNDHANMSWGHAASPDLFHWEELPVAIMYDEHEAIYSGSVVVDHSNTSGIGTDDELPLVAIYTSAYSDGRQAQSLASSVDGGMTWTKYAGNPVLDRNSTSFRDPKVFWYRSPDGAGYWVMVVADSTAQQVLFYSSSDLIQWTLLSSFGPFGDEPGLWECPDLFWLPVEDRPDEGAWVLIISVDPGQRDGGSSTRYLVGDFDGRSFQPDSEEGLRRVDWGRDFYAAVTFHNAPDGRHVLLGWTSNWNYATKVPTAIWRGAMSLPREISLRTDLGRRVLVQAPVHELRLIGVGAGGKLRPFDLEGWRPLTDADRYRLDVEFAPKTSNHFGVDVFVGEGIATSLEYDRETQLLTLDRTRSGRLEIDPSFPSRESAPVPLRDGTLHLTVIVDSTSVEVFAQGGSVCLTDQVFADTGSPLIALTSRGGVTRILSCQLVGLEFVGAS